jgi:hypothetical protein
MTAAELKERLEASVVLEDAANALRAAKSPQELVAVWWAECDWTEGEMRSHLVTVYREQLRKRGAMAP